MTVIYAYVPFLKNSALMEHADLDQMEELLENFPDGLSDSCCWSTYNNNPLAILVFDNAIALYEDIMSFCKGFPNKYFNLEFSSYRNSYALGLVPNLEFTTQVVNNMRMMSGKMPVLKPDIAYVPLHFSCRNSKVLNGVEIDDTIAFGLLDSKDLCENIDTSNVMVVGEFPISEDSSLVDDLINNMTGEIIPSIVN